MRVSHEDNAEQKRLHGIHPDMPTEAGVVGYTRVDAEENYK